MSTQQPRNAKLTARVNNSTYAQLLTLTKTTGQPLSKVTADVIAKGLRDNA